MAKKIDIHAVEMVRHIRDEQAELLRGMSNEEIIQFFSKFRTISKKGGSTKGRRREARLV